MIFVSNHCSYVDAIVLLAFLPINSVFVGKKELLKVPVLRHFFKKLGYLAIDRLDVIQSLANTQQIEEKLLSNQSMAIFPEGMFTYATGLRPFKQGAFKIAVDTALPVCPIALQGTRSILRSGAWLLRPGAISVTVGAPLIPKEKGWNEIVRLRTEARIQIAKHCGEPVIDLVMAGPISTSNDPL